MGAFGPSGPSAFSIISPPRLSLPPLSPLFFSLYRSFIVKRIGAAGAANKNGGFVVGPALGPRWVRGYFAGSACRTMAGFWQVGMCRDALESVAVCGRLSKEWCVDPGRTQGGPRADPAKRGSDFGAAAGACLSVIREWLDGVVSGVVLRVGFGSDFGIVLGWVWAIDFERVLRRIRAALPHRPKAARRRGIGCGFGGAACSFFS